MGARNKFNKNGMKSHDWQLSSTHDWAGRFMGGNSILWLHSLVATVQTLTANDDGSILGGTGNDTVFGLNFFKTNTHTHRLILLCSPVTTFGTVCMCVCVFVCAVSSVSTQHTPPPLSGM